MIASKEAYLLTRLSTVARELLCTAFGLQLSCPHHITLDKLQQSVIVIKNIIDNCKYGGRDTRATDTGLLHLCLPEQESAGKGTS